MRIIIASLAACAVLLPPLASAGTQEVASTIADRQSLNVTVYNGGTSLVHDRRTVRLEQGANDIAWRDVSAGMDATSALLQPVGGGNRIDVLEQNFDYDVLNPQALLDRYVGREVVVVHEPRFPGDRETRETAKVLSTNGGIVLQYRDRIETGVRGYVAFPDVPKDFRDQPTLALDLQSERAGSQSLDLSYLTSGLSWRADYVGVVANDGAHLALTGAVTISNESGSSYPNARLQLVAGNVNVVRPAMMARTIDAAEGNASAPAPPSEENYFEYHLYTMPRATTLLDKQTKQLTLLSAHDVPIRKTLELRGSPDYYRNAEPDIGDKLPIGVYVTFENRGGDLGVPLPAGIVRVYENDARGTSQFLGSDTIDHTPKNEPVRMHLGDSFDVTARKRQTDFHAGSCVSDGSYAIVLSNAKSADENVTVIEPIPGEWQITSENYPHAKSSASTATWLVRVPADGRATLDYTAKTKWC